MLERLGGIGSYQNHKTAGWSPSVRNCDAEIVPALVFSTRFAGAGTVGLVADRLQRDAILIEISPEYADMARKRIHGDAPLFAEVEQLREEETNVRQGD